MSLEWTPSSLPVAGDALTNVLRPGPASTGLSMTPDSLAPVLERVRAEYRDMPGLNLTREQAQVLWGLDAATCARVLDTLVAAGALERTEDGMYVRAGA